MIEYRCDSGTFESFTTYSTGAGELAFVFNNGEHKLGSVLVTNDNLERLILDIRRHFEVTRHE